MKFLRAIASSSRPFLGLLSLVLITHTSLVAHAASEVQWNFRVYLDDDAIGRHDFNVSSTQGVTVVRSEAAFRVKFLGITAYRYRHSNTEKWLNNCVQQVSATTDDNGTELFVRAERTNGATAVQTTDTRYVANDCVRTFAYWDLNSLKSAETLLNTQTGESVKASLRLTGTETIVIQGEQVVAERYRLKAQDLDISLWYSPQGRWLQLDSLTLQGKRLRYRLM